MFLLHFPLLFLDSRPQGRDVSLILHSGHHVLLIVIGYCSFVQFGLFLGQMSTCFLLLWFCRRNLKCRLYANSLIGVGVASSMYHASRGKTRKYLRWADYTMVAIATMVGLIDEQFSYVKLYEFSNSRGKKKSSTFYSILQLCTCYWGLGLYELWLGNLFTYVTWKKNDGYIAHYWNLLILLPEIVN